MEGDRPGRLQGLQTSLRHEVFSRLWQVLLLSVRLIPVHLFLPPFPSSPQLIPFLSFHSVPSLNLLSLSRENSPKVNFSLKGGLGEGIRGDQL